MLVICVEISTELRGFIFFIQVLIKIQSLILTIAIFCIYPFLVINGSIVLLFRLAGRLVKFSLDPVIAEEECLKLLDDFMPHHIRNRKITQRLFIK